MMARADRLLRLKSASGSLLSGAARRSGGGGGFQRAAARRDYNFASSQYAGTFGDFPPVDVVKLRADTVAAIEAFDAEAWHTDPLRTVVNGVTHGDGASIETTDAFDVVNGQQVLATPAEIESAIGHLAGYTPPTVDLRAEIRAIEAELLSDHAAFLVSNQAMDFKKQDGVTEIEESIEANVIERGLNDQLLADELAGKVSIARDVAFVGCVSNFSNFLDLCRKTLRNLELGVPCCVLSRSNTTQHMYRWFQLLEQKLADRGVDPGMLSFVSADIEGQRKIMAACPASPLYLTGSRPVAEAIKQLLPATFSSTGGPNTMVVAGSMTPAIADAMRISATIENSGQCTALRHLVAPGLDSASVAALLDGPFEKIESPDDSLRAGGFAGLYNGWAGSFQAEPGYSTHPDSELPVAFKVEDGDNFPYGIKENWRRVYVDVTSPATPEELASDEYISKLSRWLTTEQPITLAINGDDPAAGYPIAMRLFEQTAQVVYSIGTPDTPCYTCQARPQDGEVFGEFPPRHQMRRYTKAPVVVPTSTPSYNTNYTQSYLIAQAAAGSGAVDISALTGLVESAAVQGYMRVLADYLADACGPKTGFGQRTTLWGLQRPPLNGDVTVLRCGPATSFDDVAVYLLPFHITNAASQMVVSYDPANVGLAAALGKAGLAGRIECKAESAAEFERTAATAWNVLEPDVYEDELPLVGQFISLLFPLGHIKSTESDNAHFVETFTKSQKWLLMA